MSDLPEPIETQTEASYDGYYTRDKFTEELIPELVETVNQLIAYLKEQSASTPHPDSKKP